MRVFRILYSIIFYLYGYILWQNLIQEYIEIIQIYTFDDYGIGFLAGVAFSDILSIYEDYYLDKQFVRSSGFATDRWLIMGAVFLFNMILYITSETQEIYLLKLNVQGFSQALIGHSLIFSILIKCFPRLDGKFREIPNYEIIDSSRWMQFIPLFVLVMGIFTTFIYFEYNNTQIDANLVTRAVTMLIVFLSSAIIYLIIFLIVQKIVTKKNEGWFIVKFH